MAVEPRLQILDDLVDHCCVAWNKLVNQPWRIMSIGLRHWRTSSDQWTRYKPSSTGLEQAL